MTKLFKTYQDDGIEILELVFRGESFSYSMIPNSNGKMANNKGFEYQVKTKWPELKEDDYLMELLDNLSFDDWDVCRALEEISEWE